MAVSVILSSVWERGDFKRLMENECLSGQTQFQETTKGKQGVAWRLTPCAVHEQMSTWQSCPTL